MPNTGPEGTDVIEQDRQASDCEHHWVIESPNGPTSTGVCKVCGESSEFKNSMPGSGWDRNGAHRKRARQASAQAKR